MFVRSADAVVEEGIATQERRVPCQRSNTYDGSLRMMRPWIWVAVMKQMLVQAACHAKTVTHPVYFISIFCVNCCLRFLLTLHPSHKGSYPRRGEQGSPLRHNPVSNENTGFPGYMYIYIYIYIFIGISYMVLCAGNGADGSHLSQREGQAHRAGGGEEHAIDQRHGPAVLEAKLEAGGHTLPGGEEGDGHAEDREGCEVSLQGIYQLCSLCKARYSILWHKHTFSSCVAPMRLMAMRSSVRDDLALLGSLRTISSADLDSMGAISKECAMVACAEAEARGGGGVEGRGWR